MFMLIVYIAMLSVGENTRVLNGKLVTELERIWKEVMRL
jgi:hypothetical protein